MWSSGYLMYKQQLGPGLKSLQSLGPLTTVYRLLKLHCVASQPAIFHAGYVHIRIEHPHRNPCQPTRSNRTAVLTSLNDLPGSH